MAIDEMCMVVLVCAVCCVREWLWILRARARTLAELVICSMQV